MNDECGMQLGTFCWVELMTRDTAAAKEFYTKLVGWQAQEQDVGPMKYTMFTPPGGQGPVAGMMSMDDPQFRGIPPHWMPYIAVANVDQSAVRCKELGGKVKMSPTDIPNIGRFCVIEDPTGAVISLFSGPAGA
ncbi:MAG: VOC family protein [Phycisphaerae bacterium]|nr:VOC family protein [Phycisphaerae bacterium]